MRHFVTCPRCATTLRVPPDSADDFVTCPRCLAEVPRTGSSPPPAGVRTQPGEPPGSEPVCQECGEVVGRDWRYCPNCQEPLGMRGLRGRSLDYDVRRDNTFLRISMILLAVLGGCGISWMLLTGVADVNEGDFTMLGFVLAGVFVVGLIAALTVVFGPGKKTGIQAVGLAAYRSLTIAGIAVLLFFLFSMAFGIYLLAMCLQGKSNF
jgi:hypothetical protein